MLRGTSSSSFGAPKAGGGERLPVLVVALVDVEIAQRDQVAVEVVGLARAAS
jgi:hypothetical protein